MDSRDQAQYRDGCAKPNASPTAAAFIARHNRFQWSSSTAAKATLEPMVKEPRTLHLSDLYPENQLCVPTMSINGESFRLKDKRKAGMLAKTAKH
jgi:hypothetical protein